MSVKTGDPHENRNPRRTEKPEPMKSGVVAVVGRPSAGKSSLMNAICGHKISIVASVPQTTRNTIRGILTTEDGQIVFLDTPGFHRSNREFNMRMRDLVGTTVREAECILYIIDATRAPGAEETMLAEMVASAGLPVVIAVNKIDLPEANANAIEAWVATQIGSTLTVRVSALSRAGIGRLVAALYERLPEGELMYPSEFYTDQEPEFRAAEIIREQAVNRTREELPHSLYVEVHDMEKRPHGALWVRADILVEKESQKGIVVGKGGSLIKEIRLSAQKELADVFERRVELDLRVKLNHNWTKKDAVLRRVFRSTQ